MDFFNEINSKKSLISYAVYGRRHSNYSPTVMVRGTPVPLLIAYPKSQWYHWNISLFKYELDIHVFIFANLFSFVVSLQKWLADFLLPVQCRNQQN